MRKIVTGLLVLIFMLALAACSFNTKVETKTFIHEAENIEISFTHEDDKVITQTTKVEIPFALLQIETKEEAEELLQAEGEIEDDIKGFTRKTEVTEESLVMEATIVVKELENEEAAWAAGLIGEFNDEKEISLSEAVEEVKEGGFTEK